MRVLFTTPSQAGYMAPPQLGDEQVNCGPHWKDVVNRHGHYQSLATPVGPYDLAAVAAKLPPGQEPDAVVCLVDASWRNLPRNLAAFKCPRVLLVADTHHLNSPLIGMIRYLAAEPYDRVVFLYDRHHAGLFRSVGFHNLYWFPGLTFPHGDAAVRAARQEGTRVPHLAFVGQAGKHHPRRERLLAGLRARGVAFANPALAQAQALPFYGSALAGFNASLNGDLNLRVFEILASGAALLTDRLAPASGLSHLLLEGRELLAYGSPGELAERALQALARPAETRALGAAGARWFDQTLGEVRRRARFRALVFDGTPVPEFDFPPLEKTQVFFPGNTDRVLQATLVYQAVQELHREQETVEVVLDDSAPADAEAILATLPRVHLRRGRGDTPPDFGVIGRAGLAGACGHRLWCWDAGKADLASLAPVLAGRRYLLTSEDVTLFTLTPPLSEDSPEAARLRGDLFRALTLAQEAVKLDPADLSALTVIAKVAERAGNKGLEAQILWLLRETDPANVLVAAMTATPPDVVGWRAKADRYLALKDDYKAAESLALLTRMAPEDRKAWDDYAKALIRSRRAPEALAAAMRLAELEPASWAAQLQLGHAALGAGHGGIAEEAFARMVELKPAQKAGALGLAEARARRAATPPPEEGHDLIICHLEITRLHGTGVLIKRFFPDAGAAFISLRSHSLYQGEMEIGGQHWVIEPMGLSVGQREARLRRLLAGHKIRRILCIPYYPTDFLHGYLAKKITGAPLCTYVMDDQTIYGGAPANKALSTWTLSRSDLRLVISPEMARAYERHFKLSFAVVPPLLTSTADLVANAWAPGPETPRCALVGNIWTLHQFEQVRQLVRAAGLKVDWFGNAAAPWIPQDHAAFERDGIHCRGFLPERDLARRLADYPFVIVPSGHLAGKEDNEALTRLSLPSRMVFILAQTFTPMLVLGSPATAAAGFVRRLGIGLCASYEPADAAAVIQRMLDPAEREPMVAHARRIAPAFVMPGAGDWIWRSLAAGRLEENALTAAMQLEEPAAVPELAAAG
jgi:tetratricopeptide (TPR) repeat protein